MGATVSVVLVPVSLAPAGEGNDVKVVGYRPDGWPSRTLGPKSPTAAAEALLEDLPDLEPGRASKPEAVGFVPGRNLTTLVFSAPIPMASTLKHAAVERSREWVSLSPAATDRSGDIDPVKSLVANYWRHALAETTAVFDLLPRYFTTAQARSAYGSIWGDARDSSNFHRWLHTSNRGACHEVPIDRVDRDVDHALSAGLAVGPVTKAVSDRAVRSGLKKASRLVGTSPVALGPVAGTLLPVVLAAAAAGGSIAYQRSVTRGKTPTWFQRATDSRVVLTEPYTPHPDWLRPGQPVQPLVLDQRQRRN